jgi:hydroxymethylglutaryl-CoA lyase
MYYPADIKVREVSPRDGLQAEQTLLSTADKVALINALSAACFPQINAVSFVSQKVIPQMADAAAVMERIDRRPGTIYDATVPNMTGLRRAIDAGMDAVVVFVTPSEEGSRSNLNRSSEETIRDAEAVLTEARSAGLIAIGTVSSAFGSPYGEIITDEQVLSIARRLVAAGANAIALGDTSGEATPAQVSRLVRIVTIEHPHIELSLHLHDTRGLALANVVAAMDAGATSFDSAIGGIGGSPLTKNSAGNLATEDLLSMCDRMSIRTGIDLNAVLDIYEFLGQRLGHGLTGKVGKLERCPAGSAQ